MSKTNISFVCSSCGYDSQKWYGKCPECGEWNTMKEFKTSESQRGRGAKSHSSKFVSSAKPTRISDVKVNLVERFSTGFSEFDRVLGEEARAGIVPGSVVLLSGDPGVGKSTILLQTALNLADSKGHVAGGEKTTSHSLPATRKILYVTGEESEAQVTLRAQRLQKDRKTNSENLFILATSDIDLALEQAQQEHFDLLIIDSIQTMESGDVPGYAGSIPQVRHATGRLVAFAKTTHTPVFLIGHVTKEGMVAGPMMLSHMVDTVLYLEGEKMTGVRILRAFKNRFGDTSEVGIFGMEEYGLKQITDLSELFMGDSVASPGSCVAVIMEGSRPILVEIQALVIHSSLAFPRRVANGVSEKRLELLLAILQKHGKLPLDKYDVYVNVVGGFKISEPASDLAVCLSIISSLKGKSLAKTAAIAEVGLLGEIKKVMNLEKRIKEAKKFGFKAVTMETAKGLLPLVSKLS
ncbi:MAG: DNA repair protein RadA [Candidatus Levyibacteriota bacterium]